MIRKLLIAAAFSLAASAPAFPQAGQFPPGYVQGNAGVSAAQGHPVPGILASPFVNPLGVIINPPANSLNQAIVTNQSTPSTGNNVAGPFAGNLISFVDNDYTVTGSGLDPFGILVTNSAAFRVNNTVTYTSTGTVRYAAIFAVDYTGINASAQPVGSMSSVYSITTSGSLWGGISHAGLGIGGTTGVTGRLFGHSFEVGAVAGTTVAYRAGGIAFSEGGQRAGTYDAAFMVATQNITGYGTAAGWLNAIGICNICGGLAGLDTSANIISADSATTIANAFNLSNVTITGNLISSQKTTISGSTGTASFGGGSLGLLSINPSTNAVHAYDYFQTSTASADNNLAVMVTEAANADTLFGLTITNWAVLRASGANNQGLVVGTATSKPLAFATNNAFAGLINGSQQWLLGTTNLTPASGTTLTVDQNTGGTPATSAIANILAQYIAADSVIGLNVIDTFGAQGFLGARYAAGTQASKSAAGGSTTTFSLAAQGWDGSAYGTGAAIDFKTTASAWTGSNHGTLINFRTIVDGSTTLTQRMTVVQGLYVGSTVVDAGAGNIEAQNYLQTGAVAVASLPSCAAGSKGARYFVTDANATFTAGIGATVAAGGANNVPVTCDGTNWRIGANENDDSFMTEKAA